MFGDCDYFTGTLESTENPTYYDWKRSVSRVLANRPNTNLVILEMGCGKNVPTVRYHSQSLLTTKLAENSTSTLIRINPDFPELDGTEMKFQNPFPCSVAHKYCSGTEAQSLGKGSIHIPIQSRALPALEQINKLMQKMAPYSRVGDKKVKKDEAKKAE